MKWPVWRPLLAAIALSALIRAFDIDQSISAMCYDPALNAWPLERAEPWYGFYWYGRVPPISLGILGGLFAVFGRSVRPKSELQRTIRLQRAGLFLALMLLIGPGLIVEVAMKSLWGRPRPIQCEEFGGDMTFLPVGHWSEGKYPYTSFPSGHAAVAFFMMGPAFVVGSSRSRLYWLIAGIAYGAAMGVTRVVQGGHFPSDVLWAGVIVYLVGAGLARVFVARDVRLGT